MTTERVGRSTDQDPTRGRAPRSAAAARRVLASPAHLGQSALAALQRSIGNQAVNRLFVQRLTEPQRATLQGAAAGIRDYAALKATYPTAVAIEALVAARDASARPALQASRVSTVLGMAVVLHGNASALKGALE